MARMKAFVMKEIDSVAMVEKDIPLDPGPNEAVVRTTRALICTSDVHTVSGGIGQRENLTLGHEAVGLVEKLGSEVRGFRKGDRVAVNAITPDFTCHNCQRGYPSQCGEMLGGWKFANTMDGVFAERFLVNQANANLTHIPDDLPDEKAVYACDMLSTGFAGAENADIPAGGIVAVFAQGPVGLMATAGARLLGAGRVITVESVPNRIELSRHYGADDVVNFQETDPVEAIMDLTGGTGVDSAIESLGAQETFEACVKVTRPGGTISNVGYYGKGEYVKIPRAEWGVGMGDKTIRTALCPGGSERMERLFRLMRRGRVDPTPMTTHEFDFQDIEKAFQLMKTKEDEIIKPLIKFL